MLAVEELLKLYAKSNREIAINNLIKKKIALLIKKNNHPKFYYTNELMKALINFNLDCEIHLDVSDVKIYTNKSDNNFDYFIQHGSKYYGIYVNLRITIKFDEVEMTNRNEISYFINNLFVRFNISSIGVISKLQGTRSSISYEEYKTNYIHSHLPRGITNLGRFTGFCIGENSELTIAQAYFNESVINKSNIYESFLFFLNQIEAFVKYESLEGGPYVKIEEVYKQIKINNKPTRIDFSNLNSIAVDYLETFKYLTKKDLSEIIDETCAVENKVHIMNEHKFKSILFSNNTVQLIYNNISNHYFKELLVLTYNGKDVTTANKDLILNLSSISNNKFEFNGEKIIPIVKSNSDFDTSKIKYDLHHSFKNYIVQHVKRKFCKA